MTIKRLKESVSLAKELYGGHVMIRVIAKELGALLGVVRAAKAADQLLNCLNELPPDLRRKLRETGLRKALLELEEK